MISDAIAISKNCCLSEIWFADIMNEEKRLIIAPITIPPYIKLIIGERIHFFVDLSIDGFLILKRTFSNAMRILLFKFEVESFPLQESQILQEINFATFCSLIPTKSNIQPRVSLWNKSSQFLPVTLWNSNEINSWVIAMIKYSSKVRLDFSTTSSYWYSVIKIILSSIVLV